MHMDDAYIQMTKRIIVNKSWSIRCTWKIYIQKTTRIIVNKSWRVYIVHGRCNQTTTRMLSTNVSTQHVETEIKFDRNV